MLYGCEAWDASQVCDTKRLQVFITKCLRGLLRIGWTGRVSNREVWNKPDQVPVGDEIGKRRWRSIGHSLVDQGRNITKKALDWNPPTPKDPERKR